MDNLIFSLECYRPNLFTYGSGTIFSKIELD